MDIASVLAKFAAPGQIESRTALDAALLELLECVAKSNDDAPSLLSVIANGTPGLLEAVLTSCNHNAFTFRSRMAKSIRKSIATTTPVFRTCTGRLGLFLISLPTSVALDRRVMEDYNALTSALVTEDPAGSENSVAKRDRPEPKSPTRSSRRSQRLSTTSLTSPVLSKKGVPKSDTAVKPPAPSESLTNDGNPSSNHPRLLTSFLENFLASCIRDDIEELAVHNLLRILTSNNVPAPSSLAPLASARQSHTSASIDTSSLSRPLNLGALSQPLHHLGLEEEDIANYLNQAPKLKSGDWPVVVSGRGIKRLREYLPSRKDLFLGIEKKIKQLSVGFFPSTNQSKLLDKDFGIPIYVAELGDDLQLIYQIDFGAPTATGQESQFIRVFGVFPRSEVDKQFWTSVAAQLARRGQEYMKRCTDREETRIRFKRIETTPPKLFSPLSISQWYKDGADIQIDKAHFLELHRVLALEKFVPLSPTFFEAVQKFDEHSFMFHSSSSEYRIIHHPSSCLVLGRSGTGKTTCMLFRMLVLEKSAQKSGRPLRQMFVTQSRMLASRVQQYWKSLQQNEDDADGVSGPKLPSLSLLELDEGAEEDALPPKFSELDDSHFPLFLTYNQLCKLLEADFGLQFTPSADTSSTNFRAGRAGRPIRQPFISFEFFRSNIWPRLDERVKKGLHPANAYGEFLGVIKGSELSFNSSGHRLDRRTYENQSSRTHAGDQSERSRIYTLFEAYMKKRPPSSYDMADRTHSIMEEIQQHDIPGRGIDFLYVDEAQDHLMVDVALLRSLCRNPHGLFFAGDTAQTISLGSTFRFTELKAFLYRLEREDSLMKQGSRNAVDPDFFQLSINYRCHSGIVNAAAFLVQLIISYFGYSIDALIPEASLVDVCDQKPIFILGQESETEFLRLISGSTQGNVRLGADQAIIVRDDDAARNLEALVGEIPGLLTLYESKGLEFDDVVLYDFFAESPATSTDWRALHHSHRYEKPFDEQKHSILRRELKSLYVGLTRARERVWIWDRSRNGLELENLLVSLHLATQYNMKEPIPQLGVSSSPEEWSNRGQQYFSKGLYSKAGICFKNAGMLWWESVCQAYNDRKTALELPQEHRSRADGFFKAAKAFARLASSSEASASPATSYRFFVNAAECYAAAKDYSTAACVFIKGQKYTEAAHHYRLSGQFDEAIGVIRQHSVDQGVSQDIIYEAKLAYIRRGNMPSLRQAWDLCGSKNQFLEFLQNHGFDEQRVTVHDNLGEFEQAGDILWAGGKHLAAVNRFRRANSASSRGKATECFLEGLRAIVSFANGYGKQSQVLSELFECSKDVELSQGEVDEVELLRAIANCDSERLKEKSRHYKRSGNMLHALFAFDAFIWSSVPRSLQSASEQEIMKILQRYLTFSALVKAVVQMHGILDKPAARHLFGVSITKSNPWSQQETISVKYPSFAHTALKGSTLGLIGAANSVVSVSMTRLELADLIRQALLARLNQVISGIDLLARKSRAFQLCASFLTTGRCSSATQELCWKDHRPKTDSTSTILTFNSQFRLHVMMISLLNQFTGLGKEGARSRAGKLLAWFTRLFKLCYPPTNLCGDLSDIKPSLIPEYLEVMSTVRSCLQETFKCLRPSQNPNDFLDNILVISLLAMAFDYIAAASYLDFKKQDLDKHLPPWKRDENKEIDNSFAREYRLLYPGSEQPLAETVLTWCTQRSTKSIEEVISFLEVVLTGDVWLDIELVVTFIEEACGQMIFDHKMRHANEQHDLVAPRSWIMRALSRGPSLPPRDDKITTLVESLAEFLKILSLEYYDDRCSLHAEGASLKDYKSLEKRNYTIIRACRCLALVGHNIVEARNQILTIFDEMGDCPFLTTISEHRSNVTFRGWDRIFQALKLASSNLDELIYVARKEGVVKDVAGLKTEFCLDRRSFGAQPTFSSNGSTSLAIARSSHPLRGPVHPPPVLRISLEACTENINQDPGPNHSTRTKTSDGSQSLKKSASGIQSLFRLHQSFSSGSIVTALEEVIKLEIQMSEACADDRFLVFCLRGLLQHAVSYIQRVDASAGVEIEKYEEEVGWGGKKARDAAQRSERISKLREIRAHAEQFVQDLRPTSDFHFDSTSNSPASLTAILEKVHTIPGLVKSLRAFTTLPNGTLPADIDEDTRVEPLLKYLAPWKGASSEGSVRR